MYIHHNIWDYYCDPPDAKTIIWVSWKLVQGLPTCTINNLSLLLFLLFIILIYYFYYSYYIVTILGRYILFTVRRPRNWQYITNNNNNNNSSRINYKEPKYTGGPWDDDDDDNNIKKVMYYVIGPGRNTS